MNGNNALDLSNYHPFITVAILIALAILLAVIIRIMRNHHIDKINESPAPDRHSEGSPLVRYIRDEDKMVINEIISSFHRPEEVETICASTFDRLSLYRNSDYINPDDDTPPIDR